MATPITATEAARNFSDLLNRIRYRGESFDIVRNGEVVARMMAPNPTTTAPALIELLVGIPTDAEFAEDLTQVQADQPALPEDPWAT